MTLTKKDIHQAYLDAEESHFKYLEAERAYTSARIARDTAYRQHVQTKDRLRFLKEEEVIPLADSPDLVIKLAG